MGFINTDDVAAHYRSKAVDLESQRVLITSLHGSEQEADLSVPVNCEGMGRVHHFRRFVDINWPTNPLPIDPASAALDRKPSDVLRAQVFQNAVCNWRCWYCFVDFKLLRGDHRYSRWTTPAMLLDLFLAEEDRAPVIDLSGGQPDLVPEWVLWTMKAMKEKGLEGTYYLWSDDNLSGDYFWRFLSEAEREFIATFRGYGRVGCFKGFNSSSFSFNTKAAPDLFERQFQVFNRLLSTGIDLYAYATFTTPDATNIRDDMKRFVDRLQEIDANLPLRTIPLKVFPFSPVTSRNIPDQDAAFANQLIAIQRWQEELQERFSAEDRATPIQNIRYAPRFL
jgi:uncharacterized Fe-S cluster-containing radical SAM superfamily protein